MKSSDGYCKECTESGKVVAVAPSHEPTVAESVPVPKGTPKRVFFVVGGVGCIVNTIAAIWSLLGALPLDLIPSGLIFRIMDYVLLVIGLILASVGYLGVRRNYGSGIGLAGFVVGVVVSVLFLLWTVWDYIIVFPMDGDWMLVVYFEVTVYNIFFIMMILWGVAHIITRRFTSKSVLSFATGITLFMTAVFLEIFDVLLAFYLMWGFYPPMSAFFNSALIIFRLIWTFLFLVSEILAAILFFAIKIPKPSTKPS